MKIFMTFLVLLLWGCNTKSFHPMNVNEKLFRAKCSSCHSLPNLDKYTNEQWKMILQEHLQRTKLNEKQMIQILRYFQDNH